MNYDTAKILKENTEQLLERINKASSWSTHYSPLAYFTGIQTLIQLDAIIEKHEAEIKQSSGKNDLG